jgi:hypothetical protein
MTSKHNLRFAKIPLNYGTGSIPALGFGTLIPDLAETRSVTTNALRVGFVTLIARNVIGMSGRWVSHLCLLPAVFALHF